MTIRNKYIKSREELNEYLLKRKLDNSYCDIKYPQDLDNNSTIIEYGVIHFSNYGNIDGSGKDYILESPVEILYDYDDFDCPQIGPFLQFPLIILCDLEENEVIDYILNNYILNNIKEDIDIDEGWTTTYEVGD